MKAKSTQGTRASATKPTKAKTAASLRDLPAKKNPRGGAIKHQEQGDK